MTPKQFGDAGLQWGDAVRMEPRVIRDKETGAIIATEFGVYQWRKPTKAEQETHGWTDADHMIWGLVKSYKNRDQAVSAAAALAAE